jgi:dTDP-4-amino-4,6-dideoxygalactose transaminase
MDVSQIEKAVTAKTKAIIPVHYAGQPCDMDQIGEFARRYDLHVIEDAAHALPTWYKTKKIGTISDMTCFSFYATKTLSTGEGGMVTTGCEEWADRIARLRLHGINRDAWKRYSGEGSWYYEVAEAGYKYNMTDIHAALGLAQLKKLEWMWERRKKIADIYTEAFTGSEWILPPRVMPDRTSAWHLYVIKLNLDSLKLDRAQFIEELSSRGIGVSVHFIPLHRQPFYRNTFRYEPAGFRVAERIYERIVSLPIYPGMTDGDVARVADTVMAVADKFRR